MVGWCVGIVDGVVLLCVCFECCVIGQGVYVLVDLFDQCWVDYWCGWYYLDVWVVEMVVFYGIFFGDQDDFGVVVGEGVVGEIVVIGQWQCVWFEVSGLQ